MPNIQTELVREVGQEAQLGRDGSGEAVAVGKKFSEISQQADFRGDGANKVRIAEKNERSERGQETDLRGDGVAGCGAGQT